MHRIVRFAGPTLLGLAIVAVIFIVMEIVFHRVERYDGVVVAKHYTLPVGGFFGSSQERFGLVIDCHEHGVFEAYRVNLSWYATVEVGDETSTPHRFGRWTGTPIPNN